MYKLPEQKFEQQSVWKPYRNVNFVRSYLFIKANGYDLLVAVSFTFLSRPRNVKCRGASAEPSSQDTKIWSESRCLAHNDRQHSGFYVGKEFDNKKLQEHYDFWHQAS